MAYYGDTQFYVVHSDGETAFTDTCFSALELTDDRDWFLEIRERGEPFIRFTEIQHSVSMDLYTAPEHFDHVAQIQELMEYEGRFSLHFQRGSSYYFDGLIENREDWKHYLYLGNYAPGTGISIKLTGTLVNGPIPGSLAWTSPLLTPTEGTDTTWTLGDTVIRFVNLDTSETIDFGHGEFPVDLMHWNKWVESKLIVDPLRRNIDRFERTELFSRFQIPIRPIEDARSMAKIKALMEWESRIEFYPLYDSDTSVKRIIILEPGWTRRYRYGFITGDNNRGIITLNALAVIPEGTSPGTLIEWDIDTGKEWDGTDEEYVDSEGVTVVDGPEGEDDTTGYLQVGMVLDSTKAPMYEMDVDWLNTELGTSLTYTRGKTLTRWQDASGNWHLYGVVQRGTQHYCIAEYDETDGEWDSVLHSFNAPRDFPNVMTAQIDRTILCFINYIYSPISDVVYTTDGTTFSTVQTTGGQDYHFVGGICEHGGDFFIAGQKKFFNGVSTEYTPMVFKFTTSTKAISVVYTGTMTTVTNVSCVSICSDGTNMYVGVSDYTSTSYTEILRSEDDGGTWSQVYAATDPGNVADASVTAACAYSSALGRVVFLSDDYAVYTNDGGDNWTEQALSGISLSYQNDIEQISAYVDSNGDNRWAVTYRGATGPNTISVSFDDDFSDAAIPFLYGGIYSIETWPFGASSRVIPGIGLLLQGDTEYVAGGGYGPNAYFWIIPYATTGSGYYTQAHDAGRSARWLSVVLTQSLDGGTVDVKFRANDSIDALYVMAWKQITITDGVGSLLGNYGRYAQVYFDYSSCGINGQHDRAYLTASPYGAH